MHPGGLAGTDTTPATCVEVSAVFFRTRRTSAPIAARDDPEAPCIVERLIDIEAREIAIDRAELRRREEALGRGRLHRIGFANIIEQTSQAQGETVMVRLDPGAR